MDYAAEVLVVGGIVELWVGVITGVFMGQIRQTQPEVPKYLNLTHVGRVRTELRGTPTPATHTALLALVR